MITIINEKIEQIPILHVVEATSVNKSLPTVIYYHGYRGEKESNLTIAYKLASKGMRVILPDSIMHGERKENTSSTELDIAFWDIVIANIEELSVIKNYLEKKQLMNSGEIGVAGTSMGGITTFGALRKYQWIKAAAVLMGTPNMLEYAQTLIDGFNEVNEEQISKAQADEALQQLAQYDLSLEPKHLENRPLLIWHGNKDKVVPHKQSEQFYEYIKGQYNENDLQFILEADRSHHISRLAIQETTKWFVKHIL